MRLKIQPLSVRVDFRQTSALIYSFFRVVRVSSFTFFLYRKREVVKCRHCVFLRWCKSSNEQRIEHGRDQDLSMRGGGGGGGVLITSLRFLPPEYYRLFAYKKA